MVENILIGILASVVATMLCWFLSQLYSFDTRKKVEYKIMLLRNDNYDYQKYLEYQDYDLALNQVQRMLDEIGDLYAYIKPLTYCPQKRKLIYTLLNNLHQVISHFQRYYDGYDKECEKEACCYKAQRHLYSVGYEEKENGKYPDPALFQSITEVSIELLSELNSHKKVKNVLKNSFCFNDSPDIEKRKKYLKDLIVVDSFKNSYMKEIANKFFITTKGFKREDYNKLIDSL